VDETVLFLNDRKLGSKGQHAVAAAGAAREVQIKSSTTEALIKSIAAEALIEIITAETL